MSTVAVTAYAFLRGQLAALHAAGFEVTLITSPDAELEAFATAEGVQVVPLPMAREISVWADVRSLIALTRLLHRLRPDIVNAGTPKAGLLGMLAAWFNRTPVRIYHLRGLRLETTTGFKRTLLTWMERTAAACSRIVLCDSESLRLSANALKLAPTAKLIVLGSGSCNGIDLYRFKGSPTLERRAQEERTKLNIPTDAPVIGFVGRLTPDKGIVELVDGFDLVQSLVPAVHLVLVGSAEDGDPMPASTLARLRTNPAIHMVGFVRDAVPYYHLMDVLAFPSHREGFPYAPLEASAAGRPVAGYRVTGVVDAVVDGATGLLVTPHDVMALGNALRLLLVDDVLRKRLGSQAQARVASEFDQQVVWQRLVKFYKEELAAHC